MNPSILFFLFFLFGTSLADCKYKYIHNASELISFSTGVNGGTNYYGYTVYLVADIDFTGLSSRFRSISKFRGTFDGQGYVIKNLVVSGSYCYSGLFGYSYGLTVKNTVIASSCSFTSSYSVSGAYPKTGGIIGQCEPNSGACIFENNVNMANLRYTGSRCYNTYIGGIAGWFGVYNNKNEAKIVSCANYGTIRNSGGFSNAMLLGGIVGEIYESAYSSKDYIYNCLNYGTVKNDGSASNYLGGIISLDYGATIQNCFSSGKVTPAVAGIIYNARSNGVTVNHCYWTSGTGCGSYCASTYNINYKNSAKLTTISAGHASFLNNHAVTYNWNKWAFSQNNIKITFVVHDGGGFTYSSNKMVLLPKPARRGYAFLFWCVDQNSTDECNTTYTYSTINSTTPITLYAQWAITNCSVTLNVNGGNSFPNDEGTINTVFRQEIGELPDPTRRGYTFTGWYNVAGEYVTNESIVDDMCNCSISAHWNPNNYTVTFDVSGGDELSESEKNKVFTFDKTYGNLPTPNRSGFTFDVWKTEDNISITAKSVVNISSDQTFYAQWKSNIYTVMLDENGGDKLVGYEKGIKVPSDKAYDYLPEPTRRGYTFDWWYTVDNESITNDTATTAIVTKDQTLHAEWVPNNYTVTLNVTGGDELVGYEDGVIVTFNATYDALPTPTRTGYEFTSWYTEEKMESITNDCTVNITSDCTFYANWTANIYEIEFDPCGGDGLDGMRVTFDSAYDCLPTPSREGYTFLWWYIKGTNEIIYSTTVVGTACNHVLCAAWNKNIIIFDVDGGDALGDDGKMDVTYGGTYKTLPTPTRTGYTFDGWYTDDSVRISGGSTVTISTDQTVHARWTPNDYTMPLNPNGGTIADPSVTVKYDSPYGTLPTPTRKGYTFIGWVTEKGETITIDTIVTDPCHCVLSAGWVVNTYRISFVLNGGHFTEDEKKMSITYDDIYGYLPTPVRSGYEFAGWFNEDGMEVTAESKVDVADDQTLYAEWTGNNYTVTLNPNGGELAEDGRITVTYGGTYELLPTPIRTGYSLSGWLTDNNELVTSESTVEIVGDHTLRAEWAGNEYNVTLNPNGGELVGDDKITVTYDGTYESLPTPAWKDHIFVGWFDDDGNGEEITADTMVSITEDQTLYAHWEEVISGQISIVIGKKDLSEKEIIEIIKIFTDAKFTILGIEHTDAGETIAIIKFDDSSKIEEFLTAIVESSDEMKKFIRINYSSSKVDASTSSMAYPFVAFNMLLI